MQQNQLRSLGERPKGNRALSASAALCHCLASSCNIYVNHHASAIECRETDMVKRQGNR